MLQISLNPNTTQESGTRKSPVIAAVGKIRFPTGLAFSPTGTWLVATANHKIYVATTASLKAGFVKYVSPERLTCMAFHPFEDYFATGDQKGLIRLWYCLNENLAVNVKGLEKRTQTTSFHWHAHAVSSIAFTPNGAYLLSGGEEAVLVIWQLHSGKKEFVPRLGAPISTISVSRGSGEESYLVGLADATYSFISPGSLRISRSYSGIKLGMSASGYFIIMVLIIHRSHIFSPTERMQSILAHRRAFHFFDSYFTFLPPFHSSNILTLLIKTSVRA